MRHLSKCNSCDVTRKFILVMNVLTSEILSIIDQKNRQTYQTLKNTQLNFLLLKLNSNQQQKNLLNKMDKN